MHCASKFVVSGLVGLLALGATATRGNANTNGPSPADGAAAVPFAVPAADVGFDEMLLVAIGAWLGAEFGLPPMVRPPEIKRSSNRLMIGLRYGASGARLGHSPEVIALYEEEAATIHLPEGWTGRTPAEMSMLVHELVHHLQSLGSIAYDCPEAREALAYQAQDRWLELFGSNLETDFRIDGLTLLVRTHCLH